MGRELGILLHKVLRAIPGAFILILWGQGNQALHAPAGAGFADLLAPGLGMIALAALGAWIGRGCAGDPPSAGARWAGRLLLAATAGLLALILGTALEAFGRAGPVGGVLAPLARGLWHALAWSALVFGLIGRSGRPVPADSTAG